MYAQLILFDGPQPPEVVAAADRADRERIQPLINAHTELRSDLVALYDLRQPEGGRALLLVSRTEVTLDGVIELVMTSELLPGEDPALLRGASRTERYLVAGSSVADLAGAR